MKSNCGPSVFFKHLGDVLLAQYVLRPLRILTFQETSTNLNGIFEQGDISDSNVIEESSEVTDKYESITSGISDLEMDTSEGISDETNDNPTNKSKNKDRMQIVSELLRIVETQALQGENCEPGTDLDLGDKVVSRYAQVRQMLLL